MKILVFNCGSSSLKFELLELDESHQRQTLSRGKIENIGSDAIFHIDGETGNGAAGGLRRLESHAAAALVVVSRLEANAHGRPDAIAHRVVHGGKELGAPAVVTEKTLRILDEASEFAPLHNPPAIATIRAVSERLPGLTSVVVTDTAFHQTIPGYARTYAIPSGLARRLGIRRFGFHGVGHAYMAERYAELTNRPLDEVNLITLQLGAGCSAAAIKGGRSIDTSMGLTPLEGLMMSTRCGDLDPAIVTYLAAKEHLALDEIDTLLNRHSGLLGVSGVSGDMRGVQQAANQQGNSDARLAIDIFCYRVRKYIGAYTAVLGGVEAVIFGGGIGENGDRIRAQICVGLEPLGIVLDLEANRRRNGTEARISKPQSPTKVCIIPLDEELYIARCAARLLAGAAG